MKQLRIGLLAIASIVLLLAAVWAVRLIWLRPVNIDHFFERAYIEFLWDDPELLTATGVLDRFGLDGHRSQLTDASPARNVDLARIGSRNLNLLRGYDRDELEGQQRLSYDVFHWFLSTGVAGEEFLFHDYPVSHLSGPHIDIPQMLTQVHPITSAEDAEAYVERVSLIGQKFVQTIDALAYRKELGIIAPTFILTKAIRQCDDFVAMRPDDNMLYTSLKERLEKVPSISEQKREQLLRTCRQHIIEQVYPAYKRLSAYLMQLETESMAIAGVWHLPNGSGYYRHCLLQQTTLDADPDELFDFGRMEMARIEGEMRILLNLLRYPPSMTVNDVLREMEQDRTVTFGTDSVGKAACLRHFVRTIDAIRPRLDAQFKHLPENGLEVLPVPAYREPTSPLSFYLGPKGDPEGPGRLFVNESKACRQPYFLATTYAYHEGIPGHHLQRSVQAGLKDLPTFRRFLPFTAFSEGWAMYAEELGHELMDTQDALDRLGLLQSDLFRTARMVADVGIHHRKWLRDQAVRFLMDNAGLSPEDAEDEVDRYIVWPGQGCAYKVGKMKFLELRNRVKQAKGADFDAREFHSVLIGSGPMPLDVLEQRVDEYIGNN